LTQHLDKEDIDIHLTLRRWAGWSLFDLIQLRVCECSHGFSS